MTRAERILAAGAELLKDVVVPYGFVFTADRVGDSSGGEFASGWYLSWDRRLELHVRHSLGLVRYHVGAVTLTHADYMRALLRGQPSRYPGFNDDPLDDFRDLAADLAAHAGDFLHGSGDQFRACAAWVAANPAPSGPNALPPGGAA